MLYRVNHLKTLIKFQGRWSHRNSHYQKPQIALTRKKIYKKAKKKKDPKPTMFVPGVLAIANTIWWFRPLTIFAKNFVLDVWLGSKYAIGRSELLTKLSKSTGRSFAAFFEANVRIIITIITTTTTTTTIIIIIIANYS